MANRHDPAKVMAAGDALNRGIAIINTVWLALQNAETDEDRNQIVDTLYEGRRKLLEAEKLIGVYHQAGEQN